VLNGSKQILTIENTMRYKNGVLTTLVRSPDFLMHGVAGYTLTKTRFSLEIAKITNGLCYDGAKMNLNHLTDNELIDHIIKYDEDPVRVRIATHMQRVHGAIIDDLVRAGMDDVWCTFRSVVNGGEYHSGDYIRHLENEVEYLNDKLSDANKEIKELQARTIMDLIGELKQEIKTAEWCTKEANRELQVARENEQKMKSKLDMWAILQR